MFKVLKFFLVILAVCSITSHALGSNDPAPLAFIKTTANRLIAELNKNQTRLKNNDKLVNNIVNHYLVPYVDVEKMSRMVVGKNAWQNASPDLQRQFITEFTLYVIRTYSSAFSSYEGQELKFAPMRSYDPQKDQDVQIYSKLMQSDGPPVAIDYRLTKKGGSWVIYDFSIENVSLVQNYRSQFSGTLQQGGLKQLVQEIAKHNRTL